MGIGKSIQYSIFCENYMECNNFEDFSEIKSPQKHFKKLGWRQDKLFKNTWYCAECVKKLKSNKIAVK